MPAKLTVGVRQSVPSAGRGTIEAWCQVEIELPRAADVGDDEFQSQARHAYAACWQAVEEQLCWRDGSPWRRGGGR